MPYAAPGVPEPRSKNPLSIRMTLTRPAAASNCNSWHTILAQGGGVQLENLSAKGHIFFHIDAPNEDFSCNNCHTGAFPRE